MPKPYEQMGLAEKAFYHMEQAERLQAKAEALEKRALDKAGNDQVAALLLSKDDELAFPYKQVTGSRNGHQQRAIMYGIMAALSRMPNCRD